MSKEKSKEWTNQQKALHAIKIIGGAAVALPAIYFIAKWGSDRVNTLFNAVNEDEMGIDNANNILDMSNQLGPEEAKRTLFNALANKYDNEDDNVIPLRRKA